MFKMKDTHKWTKGKTAIVVVDCILCIAIIVSSILIVVDRSRLKNGVTYDDTKSAQQDNNTATGTATARLMCAGDNLIHRGIFSQANERADGEGYDFSYSYEQIKDIIGLSDIAFLNQETIIDPNLEPSSSPDFNSPAELLDEMKNIGFDIMNQANENVLDYGEEAARDNMTYIKSKKMLLTGLYESREDMLKPQVTEVNGIKFSFVGFTEYMDESYLLDEDSDLGLFYLDDERYSQDELYETMKQMIKNAKLSSDIVCVSMHWKTEDITEPDESQYEIMDKLMEYGADIIIGSGPHVLQPFDFRENGDGEKALIMWSLGNLISCQSGRENLLGGIADITVEKDLATKEVTIKSAKLIPTVTHYEEDYSDIRIIPFRKYSAELAETHGSDNSEFTYDFIDGFYKEMYGDVLEVNWK